MKPSFIPDEVVPNSVSYATKPHVQCTEWRPCKKCATCFYRRRSYFLTVGSIQAKAWGLNYTLAVSAFKVLAITDPWFAASHIASSCSPILAGRIGPYIRVLGIAYHEHMVCPHVHYVVQEKAIEFMQKAFKKHKHKIGANVSKPVPMTNIPKFFGYLYDQNFKQAMNDPNRIKGIRCMSGSRGMSYGYPPIKEWRRYLNLPLSERFL